MLNIKNETARCGAQWYGLQSCNNVIVNLVQDESSVSNGGSTAWILRLWTFNLLLTVQCPTLGIENNENHEKQPVDSDPFDSTLNLKPSSGGGTLGFCGGHSYRGHKGLITGLRTSKCTLSCIVIHGLWSSTALVPGDMQYNVFSYTLDRVYIQYTQDRLYIIELSLSLLRWNLANMGVWTMKSMLRDVF